MYEKILEISKKLNSNFLFDYDISRLTWFRAGGKTDIYCVVRDENELEIILNNIGNVPFLVIGNGSNLLIRDGGFKGLIIKLGKSFNSLFIENNKINTGASILDFNLAKYAYLNSIRNLEFFSGIPGSLGGAIKMNAGCFGSETKDVLFSATVMKNNGKKIIVYNDQLELSYRNSNILNKYGHHPNIIAIFKNYTLRPKELYLEPLVRSRYHYNLLIKYKYYQHKKLLQPKDSSITKDILYKIHNVSWDITSSFLFIAS